MSLSQASKVVPPLPSDVTLSNFSQIIQSNMQALFQAAHVHKLITAAPKANDGNVGDIYLYDDGTSIFVYVKTNRGWAKSAAYTLI